jgi:hypothetical protein
MIEFQYFLSGVGMWFLLSAKKKSLITGKDPKER